MPQLLIGDVLRSAAQRHPNLPAIALNERTMTFAEVDAQTRIVAGALLARGVARGDRVAWVAVNSLEAVMLYSACARIGAIFTPFNPGSTEAELAALMEVAEPGITITLDGRPGTIGYGELADAAPPTGPLPDELGLVDETDISVIFFTSGTTGRPKGGMLSHRAERLRAGFVGEPRGTHVSMFPQFHMAGWAFILETWLRSDMIIWVDRPEAVQLFAAIDRYDAFSIYCIPAVWRRILEADRTGWDLSSLRIADTGTSATAPELLAGIKDAFPATKTSVVYGSTEAARVTMLYNAEIPDHPYSVGRACSGVFVRLDDAGELWVTSPYLFSGYFHNEEVTARALVDGWYRSGEIAEVTSDGYYSIVGRANDFIRTGGETVAPVEVDLVLQRHPDLSDATVVGVPDPDWGETVTAFVTVREGREITLESLREFCTPHLAKHKVPRRLVVVDAIPRTGATGQVSRARLVDMLPVE